MKTRICFLAVVNDHADPVLKNADTKENYAKSRTWGWSGEYEWVVEVRVWTGLSRMNVKRWTRRADYYLMALTDTLTHPDAPDTRTQNLMQKIGEECAGWLIIYWRRSI